MAGIMTDVLHTVTDTAASTPPVKKDQKRTHGESKFQETVDHKRGN